jgi:hypothetical protein
LVSHWTGKQCGPFRILEQHTSVYNSCYPVIITLSRSFCRLHLSLCGDALTKEMLLLLRDGPAPAKPCEGLMLLLLILLSEGEDIGLLMRGATIGATIRVTIGVTLRRPTRPIGAGATAAAAAAAALPSPPTAGGRNQGKDENRHKDLEGGSRSLSKRTCCI